MSRINSGFKIGKRFAWPLKVILNLALALHDRISLAPEATNRVVRYEAHIMRQMYHAMDQLERLQRRREGEFVPPPVNALSRY